MVALSDVSPDGKTFRTGLVDRKLKDAGWKTVEFDSAKPLARLDRRAMEEFPTENGPAGCALCVRGQIRVPSPFL